MADARRRRNLLRRLADQQDGLCFHCGLPMIVPDGHEVDYSQINRADLASIEHVTPRSLGGSNRLDNLVVAHRSCNSVRGSRAPTEDELARLAELNERRAETLAHIRGIMETTTYGGETPASLYFVDLISELEGREGLRIRRQASSLLGRFMKDVGAIEAIRDRGDWDRIIGLVATDATQKARERFPGPLGNTVQSMMWAVVNERRRRRKVAPPQKRVKTPAGARQGS